MQSSYHTESCIILFKNLKLRNPDMVCVLWDLEMIFTLSDILTQSWTSSKVNLAIHSHIWASTYKSIWCNHKTGTTCVQEKNVRAIVMLCVMSIRSDHKDNAMWLNHYFYVFLFFNISLSFYDFALTINTIYTQYVTHNMKVWRPNHWFLSPLFTIC